MRAIPRETAFLLDTGDAVRISRALRTLRRSELEGISAEMLERAARNLRAASYSLLTAARTFEHRARWLRAEREKR